MSRMGAHHVADRAHTSGADAIDARTVVLHNGAGTALYGEDTGDLEDDVCAELVDDFTYTRL